MVSPQSMSQCLTNISFLTWDKSSKCRFSYKNIKTAQRKFVGGHELMESEVNCMSFKSMSANLILSYYSVRTQCPYLLGGFYINCETFHLFFSLSELLCRRSIEVSKY